MKYARLFLVFATLALAGMAGATAATAAGPDRYILPGDKVFPEGVTYQPASGDFYVTSTTDGTIFRGNTASGTVSPFLAPGGDGRVTAVGLKVDRQGHLFIAGGSSGLIFVYDTHSGALINKFDTGAEPKTFLNDVALTPAGDAYVTDSISPILYRVTPAPGGYALEHWLDFTGTPLVYGQGFNANGIAASADGQYLIVVQSNTGKLYRVAIASRQVTEIGLGTDTVANGDGILLEGHTLYVMRNQDALLVTLDLNADYTAATVTGTATSPLFAYPTTFARAGDRFLVVNSQFDKRGPNLSPQLPFTLASVPAPAVAAAPGMPATGAPMPEIGAGLLALAGLLLGLGSALRRRAGART